MDLNIFLTVFWVLLSTVVCQYPIANGPAIERPKECAGSNCPCCATNDCGCNGNCIDGIFGGQCRNKCPDRCVACDDYSASNSNYPGYGYCTECRPGYYSDLPDYFQCNYNCPSKCVSCQSATQCHSCNKGYYLVPTTQEYGQCMACPSNCTACTSSSSCSECKTQFEGNTCEDCKDGRYGSDCSLPCPRNCKGNVCEREGGGCKECNDGFYGPYCNNSCSPNCNATTCNHQNGVCGKGCKTGHSGDRCCVEGDGCLECFSNNNCSKCVDGKHGETCENDCSASCVAGKCNKEDGVCVKPPKPGPEPQQLGAIIGGAVAGLLFIAIVVVLVVCLVRRRVIFRQGQREQTSGETHVYYNVSDSTKQVNRAAVTTVGADIQITELQLENESLKKEIERLKEENTSLRSDQIVSREMFSDLQSHYTSLDRKGTEENTYEGMSH